MKEIKIVIKRGGKVVINAKGMAGAGTEIFTEKLAKDLGAVEERHKGQNYGENHASQQVSQGN